MHEILADSNYVADLWPDTCLANHDRVKTSWRRQPVLTLAGRAGTDRPMTSLCEVFNSTRFVRLRSIARTLVALWGRSEHGRQDFRRLPDHQVRNCERARRARINVLEKRELEETQMTLFFELRTRVQREHTLALCSNRTIHVVRCEK